MKYETLSYDQLVNVYNNSTNDKERKDIIKIFDKLTENMTCDFKGE